MTLGATLELPFYELRHREFAAKFSAWVKSEIAPRHHADEAHVDAEARAIVALLGDAGWLKCCVENIDVRTLALARDILAYHSGLADFCFVMQGLGSGSISLFGSEALKKKYLPGIATGARIAAFALSEPESGSDVAAMTTAAKKDGPDYVLDGTKTWISNAGLAHQYVVFARTGEAPGPRGLSAFVVDADAKGLRVSERHAVSAPHPLGTLEFSACRVQASQLLGAPGEGFKVAMSTLDVFRPTVGAAALGLARRAMDEAAAYAQARHAFGKPLADFQLIQEKIADMALAVDTAAL